MWTLLQCHPRQCLKTLDGWMDHIPKRKGLITYARYFQQIRPRELVYVFASRHLYRWMIPVWTEGDRLADYRQWNNGSWCWERWRWSRKSAQSSGGRRWVCSEGPKRILEHLYRSHLDILHLAQNSVNIFASPREVDNLATCGTKLEIFWRSKGKVSQDPGFVNVTVDFRLRLNRRFDIVRICCEQLAGVTGRYVLETPIKAIQGEENYSRILRVQTRPLIYRRRLGLKRSKDSGFQGHSDRQNGE